jgi:hypothetical protein
MEYEMEYEAQYGAMVTHQTTCSPNLWPKCGVVDHILSPDHHHQTIITRPSRWRYRPV